MRVFESFNAETDEPCPICKTKALEPTVLVPIPGTEEGNIVQARQVHKECYDVVSKMVKLAGGSGEEV